MSTLKWGSVPFTAVSGISSEWDKANATMKQKLFEGMMVVKPSNGKKSQSGSEQYKGDNVQIEFAVCTFHGDWLIGQSRNYVGSLFEYGIDVDTWESKVLAIYTSGNEHLTKIAEEVGHDTLLTSSISIHPNSEGEGKSELTELEPGDEKILTRLFKLDEVLTLEELTALADKLPKVEEKSSSGYSRGGGAKAESEYDKLAGRLKFIQETAGVKEFDELLTIHLDKLNLILTITGLKPITKFPESLYVTTVKEEEVTEVSTSVLTDYLDSLPSRKIPKGFDFASLEDDHKELLVKAIEHDVENQTLLSLSKEELQELIK